MEKKYQIFISSTYKDLIAERKKVQDTILSMYQFPVGMELFSSADEEQWEIIKETIDSSDYYVLIIAHRYGSTITNGSDVGISYTEKEYKYAKDKQIPILAFIIDDSVAVIPSNIEEDTEKKKRLNEFIEEVTTGRMVQWWTSENDLANKVMNSLNKQIVKGKRPGWIRAETFNIEETQKELVEMNKKIRQLEEENSELKKQVISRVPDLMITINGLDNLHIPFYEENLITIDAEYLPLKMEDVPNRMKDKINQEELDKYNKSLPSQDEIDEYKSNMQFYYRATKHATEAEFKIHNNGSSKAKDIHIEVKFPEEIKIYSKNTIKNLKAPSKPLLPLNPIDKYLGYDLDSTILSIAPDKRNLFDFMNNPVKGPTYHFYNDDNSISVRMEDLINTYTWNIKDEYYIVPTKKGVFQIECCLMCEEYSDTKIQIIEITVE